MFPPRTAVGLLYAVMAGRVAAPSTLYDRETGESLTVKSLALMTSLAGAAESLVEDAKAAGRLAAHFQQPGIASTQPQVAT